MPCNRAHAIFLPEPCRRSRPVFLPGGRCDPSSAVAAAFRSMATKSSGPDRHTVFVGEGERIACSVWTQPARGNYYDRRPFAGFVMVAI